MSARVLRAAGWILLAISFFGCSAWAAGQPAPIEISNDWVIVRFPGDVNVPLDVQRAFLECLTDSIEYVEGFFGSCLSKPVKYVFTGSKRFFPMSRASPPHEIIDELGPPMTLEEARRRCITTATHELVHLHSYGVWGDHSFASMSEGFAQLVEILRSQLPPHDTAAALHAMGRLPSLRTLLTTGLSLSESERVVLLYSCTPSFLGFIYEKFGHDTLIRIYNNVPPYTASASTAKLFSLIEECTATSLEELELKWRQALRATEVSERFIAAIELWDELGHAGLFRLRLLSDHLGVEIDPAFQEELQSVVADIDRYGRGEPVSREELSRRIRRLCEWAEEIRRAMSAPRCMRPSWFMPGLGR